MIAKENRSKFLQQQLDDNKTRVSYNFIMEYKGIDSTIKILLNDMCNDNYMNGSVTWKHQTYADHLGISRQQIAKWFKRLITIGILIPNKDNKAGSKGNTFKIDVSPKLMNMLVVNNSKPVNPRIKTCKPEDIEPVNPRIKTCKPEFTYNKVNKSNKDLLTEEESFIDSSLFDKDTKQYLNTFKKTIYNI